MVTNLYYNTSKIIIYHKVSRKSNVKPLIDRKRERVREIYTNIIININITIIILNELSSVSHDNHHYNNNKSRL